LVYLWLIEPPYSKAHTGTGERCGFLTRIAAITGFGGHQAPESANDRRPPPFAPPKSSAFSDTEESIE